MSRATPIPLERVSVHRGDKSLVLSTAYCFKCRQKIEIKDPKQIILKNGRPAVQGTCPVCGTKVFRINTEGRLRKPRIVPPTKPRKV